MTKKRSDFGTARKLWAVGLLSLVAAIGGLAQAQPASALGCTPLSDFPAPPPNSPLPGSCFEGWDGNQVDPDGATPAPPAAPNRLDWGSGEVLAGAQRALDYVQGANDSQFTVGSEENPDSWGWNVGSLGSDKYNFISGYSYQEQNTQDLMLALAFVRETNNGTSWLAFELNQKQPGYRTEPLVGAVPARDLAVPTRSTGDLLITYSVSNNNSPKPVIGLCKWVGDEHSGVWANMAGVPVASNCPSLGPAVAQADLNGADIPAGENFLGSPAGLLQAGTFGEASINLSEAFKAAGGNPATEDDCLNFGYFWAHSRSSEPVTSAQQDFILPTDAISAANCSVSGTKWHDRNGNGLLDGADQALGGWTIYADYDGDGVLDPGEPSDVTAPRDGNDLRPTGTYDLVDLADGSYPIREVAQAGWTCTSPNPCAHAVEMTGSAINGMDFLNFDANPSIDLDKTAVLDDGADNTLEAGDEIDYSFLITNTGNVTLTGVDLDDDLVGFADVVCNAVATLAPGASTTCTASYTLTQADIDAGTKTNNADACGDPPSGTEVCDPDSTTTTLAAAASIDLDKTAVLDDGANNTLEAGDEIDYSFLITNTGDVTLSGVDLDDDLVGFADVVCNAVATLAPGASTTCTASYTLTQADLDAGTKTNNADACGDPPAGAEVCDPDTTTTTLTAAPAIDLEKTGSLDDGANDTLEAGDEIDYSFLITNTGNVTLSGVDLTDALVGFADATCGATTLAPGASTTCAASYTLTQADLDAGTKTNNATACADPPAGAEVCDPDTTTTPLDPDKRIDLEKTAVLDDGANNTLEAGDEIDYSFLITNTGKVTLTGVDLTDALVAFNDATCGAVTTLAPGASTSCTASYTLTQADLDAGTKTNNADACGDPPLGAEVCDPDSTTTPLPASPSISLDKTAVLDDGANNTLEAGDEIDYSFLITNSGNVTLTGVDLTDALVGFADATCGATTLAPGASTTCTATYTLTQADLNAGSKTNNAAACADPPAGPEVCDPDSTTTNLSAAPSISLDKTAVLDDGANNTLGAGDEIDYSFLITNTGNVTLTGVDLTDALVAFADATCGAVTTLAPGASTTCTATYTLTQADLDAGSKTNNAEACGDPPAGTQVCDPDSTTTPLPASPGIALDKTAVLDDGADNTLEAGDEIDFAFLITNTGNVTLSGVDLTDALVGFTDVTCGAVTTLAPGVSTNCTATYVLTQADLNAGSKTNNAQACADPPNQAAEICAPDTTTTPLDPDTRIELQKTAVLDDGANNTLEAGDEIDYAFEITNTGNVTLTGVDLTDALVGFADATCGATTLAPGASTTCTATYVLTQADLDAGSKTNNAEACGDPPAGQEVCAPDTTTTPLAVAPGIALDKTAVLDDGADDTLEAGDEIDYAFLVTNTGGVTLTGVDLTDALVGFSDATCGATTLAPGASTNCAATYLLTQADIDAGTKTNNAQACADPPAGPEVCAPDTTTTPLGGSPSISLDKSAVLDDGADNTLQAGDEIDYSFLITNPGNVTLSGVDLTDALVGFADATCGATTLAPGASTTCTATYVLTQADLDAGTKTNNAEACADPPAGAQVCAPDTTTTPLPVAAAIDLEKFATLSLGLDNALTAGDTITYEFLVTNTGNVTLTGVDLDDALVGFADATCGVTTLAPGGTTNCQVDHVLSQADIDAGSVTNAADACADPPGNAAEVCDQDTTTTPLNPNAAIQLEKFATLDLGNDGSLQAGDLVHYEFVVTNVGNVTLTGVDLDDALVGFADAPCGAATLAPGAFTTCQVDHTVTQADIDAGSVANLADVCGDPPGGGAEVCDDDGTNTPLAPSASIQLVKTAALAASNPLTAGDKITYTFDITNNGNVTLTGVDLDDTVLVFADATCGATTLAPGASTTCTVEYALTQADIDAASVTNIADACGNPPQSVQEICDDDTTTTPLDTNTGILVEKDGPATTYHGNQVTFTFLVSNTGNATLTGVTVVDDKCAPVVGPVAFPKGDDDNRLEVGEQWRFTCTKTIEAHADGEANPIVNTATASGTDPQQNTVSDTHTHSTLVLHPAVQIVKSGPASAEAGQSVGYQLTVTNPGDVPLVGQTLSVTDPQCDAPPQLVGKFRGEGADESPDTLDPGDRWVYGCSVPTAAGQNELANTAFVVGLDPNDVRVSDDDTVVTPLTQPQIHVLPETVVSGAAQLRGPSRCVSKAFTAKVTGRRISKVVWYVDGKKVKTFTNRRGTATRSSYRVRPGRYGKGVHRLRAKVTFHSASRTRSRTLRMTFQKCARQIIAPKFTG